MHEQKITDAENISTEVINVFSQTEFDNPSENEVSPERIFLAPRGNFINPGNVSHEPATSYSSLNFAAVDEFSSKNDTLQVNYASSDYLSSYSATLPRQDPSAIMTKHIHGPISPYPMIPHHNRHSPQKKTTC